MNSGWNALFYRASLFGLLILTLIFNQIALAAPSGLVAQPTLRQPTKVGPQDAIWCKFDDHACVMNVLTGALSAAVSNGLISLSQQNKIIQEAAIQLAAIGSTAPFSGAQFGLLHNIPGYSGGGNGSGGGGAGGGFLSLTEELNLAEAKPAELYDPGSYFSFSPWATLFDGKFGKAYCSFEIGTLTQWDDPHAHNSDTQVASGYGFKLEFNI